MINLFEALKTVLSEDVNHNEICEAVLKGYRIEITYDDNIGKNLSNKIRHPEGVNPTGSRTILPYCYGADSRSGADVIRAFQVTDTATRRGAPGWKYFLCYKITSYRIIKDKPFKFTPKEMGYPDAPEFNSEGDKLMSIIYAIKPISHTLDNTLAQAKAKTEYLQTAPKMNLKDGPIPYASQQRKKNVFTSQPNSKKYAEWAKNVKDTENDNIDRFNDDIWAQAEQERQIQQNVPKPNNSSTKPINTNTSTKAKTNNNSEEEENWDDWLNQSHGNEF